MEYLMSFSRYEVPPPKNGREYRGAAVCRISKEIQNEMSLEDQEALYRERLPDYIDGDYRLDVIATQGSGELLDRSEFLSICEIVNSGEYDFVIAEGDASAPRLKARNAIPRPKKN